VFDGSDGASQKVRKIVDIYEDLDLVQLELRGPVIDSQIGPASIDAYEPGTGLRIATAPKFKESRPLPSFPKPPLPTSPRPFPPGRGSPLPKQLCPNPLPAAYECQFNPDAHGCSCLDRSPPKLPLPYDDPKLTRYEIWQLMTQETANNNRDDLGFLYYDLDTDPGYSGTALFQNGKMVGIHLGFDPQSGKNIGISILEVYGLYNPSREAKLAQIQAEGVSMKKIKKWVKGVGKDPIKTLTGTLADLDPTNPNGSLAVSTDSLTRTLKEMDVMSRNSDFRQALGRIDPDHKIGKFLEDKKQTIVVVAAIALFAYGGYYLISSGAVTGEAAFIVEVGGQSITVASAEFAAAGSGAIGGATAFMATGGIGESTSDLPGSSYAPGADISSVNTAGGSGSSAQPESSGSQNPSSQGRYKKGSKVTTKGHPVGSQDHLTDVMTRIAQLSSLDPKLFENGINPEVLARLNQMIKGGAVDPALMKELRIALDTIGRSVGSSDPALAEDIDDVADAIAMQNEYGLGVPLTSDLRKLSPAQQGALQTRQLDASQKFIEERLEDSDGRGTRSEGMRFVIAAGVYKAHQAFDELDRFRTFYTQRALQLTYEFANFAVDFTTFPSLIKSADEYVQSQPRDPLTGAPTYGTKNSMDFAVDLLSILVPRWMRKGKKAADVFKDFKPYVNTASDTGKFLDKGLTAADQLYDDLLKAGVRAEDLDDVLDSAKNAKPVDIPWDTGKALQEYSSEALVGRVKVEQGSVFYRGGTKGRSNTGSEAQFWSLEHPNTPGYGDKYGIPPDNMAKFDFVETATLKNGSNFITRKAPPVGTSTGGGIEVVVPPNSVTIQSHVTL
jgi:hypothetical protein